MRLALLQDGSIKRIPTSGGDWYDMDMPDGVARSGNNAKPCIRQYKGDTVICGSHSQPLFVTREGQVLRNGLRAPETAPTLAGTSGATITAECIGYVTFVIRGGSGRVIAESNPSPASNTASLSSQAAAWSSIPTSDNDQVTHVRGYRSDDDEVAALAWEAPIGTTSYTDTTETVSLGVTLPVKVGLDGESRQDNYARGQIGYCKFVEIYHGAAWYAGFPDHPDRIYYSRIGELTAVNVNEADATWFETDGEEITCVRRRGDELVFYGPRSAYSIQGYGPSDYRKIKISNFYGCISNESCRNVGPNGDLWFASQDGPSVYFGGGPAGFAFLFEDLKDTWRDDYRADTTRYERCFAEEDRFFGAYILQIPQSDGSTFRYVGHYEPVYNSGGQPWWTTDVRAREESCMGVFASGQHFGDLYSGSCDGHVRRENILSDADDDGDSYGKEVLVAHKHFVFGDPTGDDTHARAFRELDLFLVTENQDSTASIFAGDETASDANFAQWSSDIPASAVTSPRAKVALTRHHKTVTECSGIGATVELVAEAPVGWRYRGFHLTHTKGNQSRPFSE